MDLRKNKEGYKGGFGERMGREKRCNYIVISKDKI